MNLKEAYRYANFLNELLERSYALLGDPNVVTTVKQKHFRSKAVKEAEDETMVAEKPFNENFTPMILVDFAVEALAEKEALAKAIAEAKAGVEINIDDAVFMNKKKQQFVRVLKNMADRKASVRNITGRGYRFNVNNEQVSYVYDIEETVTIDYDRVDVRNLIKKYRRETDEISAKLDQIEILTEVDFTPKWDVNDSLGVILDIEGLDSYQGSDAYQNTGAPAPRTGGGRESGVQALLRAAGKY
ncbi:MAG: hypothetical protein NC432_06230 [Roseburia sp.]|nr:hypothetical protein [Roseburia sp.]MCM1097645.1 hypothetical protein [Ruminococcus flavefaciens]